MNDEDRSPFITTYLPVAGWKAVMYTYDEDDYGWAPWSTSDMAFKYKAQAEIYAKHWAKMEGVRYVPGTEPDVPASDKSVAEQLQDLLGIPDENVTKL